MYVKTPHMFDLVFSWLSDYEQRTSNMSIFEEAPIFTTRLSYIQRIADELISAPHFLPSPDQERSYEEALRNVVSVVASQASRFSKEGSMVFCVNSIIFFLFLLFL
jgi:hypothetical protein